MSRNRPRAQRVARLRNPGDVSALDGGDSGRGRRLSGGAWPHPRRGSALFRCPRLRTTDHGRVGSQQVDRDESRRTPLPHRKTRCAGSPNRRPMRMTERFTTRVVARGYEIDANGHVAGIVLLQYSQHARWGVPPRRRRRPACDDRRRAWPGRVWRSASASIERCGAGAACGPRLLARFDQRSQHYEVRERRIPSPWPDHHQTAVSPDACLRTGMGRLAGLDMMPDDHPGRDSTTRRYQTKAGGAIHRLVRAVVDGDLGGLAMAGVPAPATE